MACSKTDVLADSTPLINKIVFFCQALIIWFVKSKRELIQRIERMAAACANAAIWIAWPKKSSGKTTDLTQAIVRESGLASGLVDYKICSIDETWSGLKFTKRKVEKELD